MFLPLDITRVTRTYRTTATDPRDGPRGLLRIDTLPQLSLLCIFFFTSLATPHSLSSSNAFALGVLFVFLVVTGNFHIQIYQTF